MIIRSCDGQLLKSNGVVWHGVALCGKMWCDVVRCGMMW